MRIRTTLRAAAFTLALCSVFSLFLTSPASAAAPRKDPLYPQMVKESSQIIDATINYVGKDEISVTVNKTIKGEAKGDIAIGSFYEKWDKAKMTDLRDVFKEKSRYIFFLKDSLVGNVPYSPTPKSVEVPVVGSMVKTSLLAPGFDRFWQDIDYTLFVRFIKELIAVGNGEEMNHAFVGEITEALNSVAKDPNKGNDQLVYLSILNDVKQIQDVKLLEQLLNSGNMNVRFIALKQVGGLEPKIAVPLILKKLDDPALLIQSLAAKLLEDLEASEAVDALAARIDKAQNKQVEQCAANPVPLYEAPKRAVLRALISFNSDKALDVIEKELLSKKVETFRLILDIFKEYDDQSIHMLLLELMQDRNFYPLLVSILDYFQAIKSVETVTHLKKIFKSQDAGEMILKSVIEVLESYKDPASVEFFIESLDNTFETVRLAAVKALGTLKDSKAIDVLEKYYFREKKRLVREFYIDSLSKIPDAKALDALRRLAEKETDEKLKKRLNQAIKESKFLSQ